MSEPGQDWINNPFIFLDSRPVPLVESLGVGALNIMKDFMEYLKSKFIKLPPAKIQPLEPVSSEAWSPERGMRGAMISTFAPDPAFLGLPLVRKDIITVVGTKGWNTHYNVIVDTSGSMTNDACTWRGKQWNRSCVCRLAIAVLLGQAKLNHDSFTLYSYDDEGRLVYPLPYGEPSYDYDECSEWLVGYENPAEYYESQYRGTSPWGSVQSSYGVNALIPFPPQGENCEYKGWQVAIDNSKKHDIRGMVTLFITDGDQLLNGSNFKGFEQAIGCSMGYDNWLRQFGHVFYILIRSNSSSDISRMKSTKAKLITALSAGYGWSPNVASMFVHWFALDANDPRGAEQMTDLFADIGRVFAGTSERFAELDELMGSIGADGTYMDPSSGTTSSGGTSAP